MYFNEKQKRKLIKMLNERFFENLDKFKCYENHQFLNDQYVLKYSDDVYKIDIILHIHSKLHRDMEIDIHEGNRSLIFDTHQYFINPKDIKKLINFLLENIHNGNIKISDKDVIDTEIILGK